MQKLSELTPGEFAFKVVDEMKSCGWYGQADRILELVGVNNALTSTYKEDSMRIFRRACIKQSEEMHTFIERLQINIDRNQSEVNQQHAEMMKVLIESDRRQSQAIDHLVEVNKQQSEMLREQKEINKLQAEAFAAFEQKVTGLLSKIVEDNNKLK